MAWPKMSDADKALRAEFLELAAKLPKPKCSNGRFSVIAAVEAINAKYGAGTLTVKRGHTWARSATRNRKGEHKRYPPKRDTDTSPAMGRSHYVRSANGSRGRLIDEIERGEAVAPWANGPDQTPWGRKIDRSRFPMPRVEWQGRAL